MSTNPNLRTPYRQFLVRLALSVGVLVVAIVLTVNVLVQRYVEASTARLTHDTVERHIQAVFPNLYQAPTLHGGEAQYVGKNGNPVSWEVASLILKGHLDVYHVVDAVFFNPGGEITYAYNPQRLGQLAQPDELAQLRQAVSGRVRTRTTGNMLHLWMPMLEQEGSTRGQVKGVVLIQRDLRPEFNAATQIQLGVLGATVLGALGLFLVLQGVFRSTTRQIAQQNQQLQQLYGQLEEAYDASLRALSNALDSRDNETGGHAERVTRYAMRLGEELGLSKEELDHLYWGALLHDIGKIGVPDRILRKPGRLDDREFHIMRAHVSIGDVIIRNINFLAQARDVVRAHHERWDGGGYPLGLSGSNIPIGARIFAVCDTYDAMTSDRPYSRKRSDAQARAEIQAQSGRQFDPKVVQAFMMIPVDDWVSLAMEPTSRAKAEIRELVEAAVAV